MLCERVEISTWPYEFKGFLGNRNFTLKSEEGEMLAYANTLWAFMDLEKARPTVINREFIDGYEMEPRLDMNYASRKVKIPADSVQGESFPVRAHNLDTNHHVNNGQYVQMAMEFMPKDFVVSQMRAEYKKQAVLGDMITPQVHREGPVYIIALCEESGEPYAVVEFTGKGERK